MSLKGSQSPKNTLEQRGAGEMKSDEATSYSAPDKLWYIHGRAYELSDFVRSHPGRFGGVALKESISMQQP